MSDELDVATPAEDTPAAEPEAKPPAEAKPAADAPAEDTKSAEDAPAAEPEAKPAAPGFVDRVRAYVTAKPDPFIGGAIALVYVIILLASARSLGFARDEGFYFAAAGEYRHWFDMLLSTPGKALERGTIDGIWTTNHEHPSLMKSLFAISYMLFHDKWKVFDDASTAFRFPGMMMMGLALWTTYMFGARVYSRRAGVIAALALGAMPRVFYNAHLACFDVPIMAMWTACIYVYWRAEKEGGLGWALFAGLMYGLTLETKHNAWLMPAVFVPHALAVHGPAMSRESKETGRIPVPATLVAMATVGPAVFLLLWPWLWNDTLPRIQEYVNFHVHHEYYNIEFLGRTYFGPPSPRAYLPVMLIATVPTATVVLFLVGAIDRVRVIVARTAKAVMPKLAWPSAVMGTGEPDRVHSDLLLLLGFLVPLAPWISPTNPIFGGTKHWIPAYPFLAIFAGRGFDLVMTALGKRVTLEGVRARVASIAVAVLTFGGAIATTAHSHPFGLSTYVPFFGGTAGGADLGLNRQFWGFTTESLAPYFAAHAPQGSSVYIMDTAWQSWIRLVDEKRVRPDLRGVGSPADADFSIVHHEQHMNEVDYNIWTEYGSSTPDYVLTHDGVPIITVYRRAGAPPAPAGGSPAIPTSPRRR